MPESALITGFDSAVFTNWMNIIGLDGNSPVGTIGVGVF